MPPSDIEPGAPNPSSRFPPWTETLTRLLLAIGFLYFFLVGIKSLEVGIEALGSGFVDNVFASVSSPLAGLAAGILATVLVQSSSVTTATIVGLVGAGVLPVETAVPMVMGANIGTTVTATLASLGHLRQSAYFQRAFAAATVHDYFNILAVLVLLPLEIGFGLITNIATRAEELFRGVLPAVDNSSPLKDSIKAPVSLIVDQIENLGWSGAVGPILLGLGMSLIFLSLWQITHQMREVMSGRMENAINTLLSKGGGTTAIAMGMVMTMAVQSSSITTSLMVPLVAAGVITLQNAFPVTLGANVGTTVTALLASVAAASPDALTIALAHVVFNVLGILIFYPMPTTRHIPLWLAERTAEAAVRNRAVVLGFMLGVFIILPLGILLIA